MEKVRLTQFSHGAGCGCKIAPGVLETILKSSLTVPDYPSLLVGHGSRDDAAVMDIGNGRAVISTTDFFMPIVDDPRDFGRIAVTNALSDVYAMGGTPLMAIAILGWPVDRLDADIAQQVVDGGRLACKGAGIPLAGGHSIDSPEPIFGAAITGEVRIEHLKRNNTARAGDLLFLTKPLGVGVLTTAEKKGLLTSQHRNLARDLMCQLNTIGTTLGRMAGVTAMTDVTGFGLAGHLLEMCHGSGLHATLEFSRLPLLDGVESYIDQGAVPGGTNRNYASYGFDLGHLSDHAEAVLCDPQTSGGLLVAVDVQASDEFLAVAREAGLQLAPIGRLEPAGDGPVVTLK